MMATQYAYIQYDSVFCSDDEPTTQRLRRMTAIHSRLQKEPEGVVLDDHIEYAWLFCGLVQTLRESVPPVTAAVQLSFIHWDGVSSPSAYFEAVRRVVDAARLFAVHVKRSEVEPGSLKAVDRQALFAKSRQLIGMLSFVLNTLIPEWEIEDARWVAKPYDRESIGSLYYFVRAYAIWCYVRKRLDCSAVVLQSADLALDALRLFAATRWLQRCELPPQSQFFIRQKPFFFTNAVRDSWPGEVVTAVPDGKRFQCDPLSANCRNRHGCLAPNQDWTRRVGEEAWLQVALYLASVDNLPMAAAALRVHAVVSGKGCGCLSLLESSLSIALRSIPAVSAADVLKLLPVNDLVAEELQRGDDVVASGFVFCRQ